MFVNKDSFSDALYWYQKKIGSYDQPQWIDEIEERVLNGIDLNVTKKVNKLKNSLIDLDYIRGSAFNKTKPKQSWLTTTSHGILRVILLPVYLNWWIEQTNKKICCILFTLYIFQLCSMFIYFNNDYLNDKNVQDIPQSEVITPLFMFFFLGILYSQIFASSSGTHRFSNRKNFIKTGQLNSVNSNENTNENKLDEPIKNERDINSFDHKDEYTKQQVIKNQKFSSTKQVNKNRIKFKTCSTRTRSTLRTKSKNESKRKRHLTATIESSITNQSSKVQESINDKKSNQDELNKNHPINDLNDKTISSNDSSINSSHNQISHNRTSIKNLQQQLKNLNHDEDDLSTSGEDCSPYSSISSNANLSRLLMMHDNKSDEETNRSKLNSFNDKESNYFEHIFEPKKTKYFYFKENANEDDVNKSTTFNEEDQNNFKIKNNLNISDSESSVSPTTPMKSLNDWPMINSENSTEDEDEEVLINVGDQKVEQKPIPKQITNSTVEPIVVKQDDKRSNNLTNKNLNFFQDEIDLKTDSIDKISCTIYKQNEWQKINLTMIDISSMIIKKVDTVRYSNEYFYFAILFSLLFAFIPQIFRFQSICTNLNNTEFLKSDPISLSNLDNQLVNCDQNDLNILDAYGIKKNNTECKILKAAITNPTKNEEKSTKMNKSAFVCAINASNSSEEFIEYLNYLPVLIFDLLIDVFKNSIYSFPMKFIVFVALIERFTLSLLFFILLCVAERTYRERFLYAKYFSHITSARRAKRNELPLFRLNKVQNIKSWLSIRSFLKKHGPQRSVDSIVSTSFILAVSLLTFLCVQLLRENEIFSENLYCYEMVIWNLAIGIFIMRLIILGSKMNRKYRSNLSVLITEQINLYLQLEQKPHKKEKLQLANNVLKLAADLLKQLEVPFKISGLSANPYLYNITKVIVLSAFSAVLSEVLGFKLKLYKIKIN